MKTIALFLAAALAAAAQGVFHKPGQQPTAPPSTAYVLLTGQYANPSFIKNLDWSKLLNVPSFALADHNHDSVYVALGGSYSNPSFITGLDWSKILNAPSFALADHNHDATYARLAGGNTLAGTQTLLGGTGIGLIVQGTTGQAADLQQWQKDAGTPATWINSDGELVTGGYVWVSDNSRIQNRNDSSSLQFGGGGVIRFMDSAGRPQFSMGPYGNEIGTGNYGPGSPGPTLRVIDSTASTGVTRMVVQEGAGQSTGEVFAVYGNDGVTPRFTVAGGGAASFAGDVTLGSTTLERTAGISLPMQASLRHWSAAIGRVLAGAGNATVACVGDSRTLGYYSAGATGNQKTKSWCYQLATLFTSMGIPASTQNFLGFGDRTNANIDSRVNIGGWSTSTPAVAGAASLGGSMAYTAGATTWSFTPTIQVDTCRFYYIKNTGLGSINLQIDAETPTTVNENAASTFASTTVTSTLGAHACNATRASGTPYLIGAEAWNSAIPQILFQVWGWSGANVGELTISGGYGYDPVPASTLLAPDLAIIATTVNDIYDATALATYRTNLTALINGFLASGKTDVILVAETEVSTAVSPEATQLTYVNAMKTVARSYNPVLPVIDEFASFGPFSALVANGQSYDTLHLTATGYGKMAADIARYIRVW